MNRVSRQQVLLLLALIVVWIGLLVWQLGHSNEPEHVPLKNVSGVAAAPRVAGGAAVSTGLHVNLERLAELTGQRQATFSAPRNIFAALPLPTPVAAAVPAAPRARRAPSRPPRPEPEPPAEVPESPAVEEPKGPSPEELERLRIATELNQYRYLGFLRGGGSQDNKKPVAVLVKDEEMHLVQAGETIAKEVLVKAISPTGITLQDLGSKVVQVIPVSDQPGAAAPAN